MSSRPVYCIRDQRDLFLRRNHDWTHSFRQAKLFFGRSQANQAMTFLRKREPNTHARICVAHCELNVGD